MKLYIFESPEKHTYGGWAIAAHSEEEARSLLKASHDYKWDLVEKDSKELDPFKNGIIGTFFIFGYDHGMIGQGRR